MNYETPLKVVTEHPPVEGFFMPADRDQQRSRNIFDWYGQWKRAALAEGWPRDACNLVRSRILSSTSNAEACDVLLAHTSC